MGTEFLVVSLWGVVLAYWLWSRRPTTSDTVGLFQRELRVLEGATPMRVAPAHRLYDAALATPPAPLAARVVPHKRSGARRRRRDVLTVLLAAVALTAALSVLTRSNIAWGAQAACDLALCAYVYLLARATRPKALAGRRQQALRAVPDEDDLLLALRVTPQAGARPGPRRELAAHATRDARRVPSRPSNERYGDFDSYASLALAGAN